MAVVGISVSSSLADFMKIYGDDEAKKVASSWDKAPSTIKPSIEQAYGSVFVKWQVKMSEKANEKD